MAADSSTANDNLRGGQRKPKRKRVLIAVVAMLAALAVAVVVFLNTSYPASPEAIAALNGNDEVTVTIQEDGDMVFAPTNGTSDRGIVFYPGGKVDPRAYAPLMQDFAKRGFTCVLVRMPFNLAVFDINAADGEQAAFPGISHWYIGGHSLGGAMASEYVAGHAGQYEGLLLCAAFPTEDLSGSQLEVESVYGSNDGVLKRDKYEENRSNAPQMVEDVIEGGCHGYFGDYGGQEGDGMPTISREEQLDRTADDLVTLSKR